MSYYISLRRLNAARASVCVCPLIFKTKLFILIFNSYGVTRAFSSAFYSVIFKTTTDKTPYLGRRHDGEVHAMRSALPCQQTSLLNGRRNGVFVVCLIGSPAAALPESGTERADERRGSHALEPPQAKFPR